MKNVRDYSLTSAIPARKKTEFIRFSINAEGLKPIYQKALETSRFYAIKNGWTATEEKTVARSLFACGVARYQMEQTDTVFDFIVSYVVWKAKAYKRFNDKGAFGDAIEAIVHLVACRAIWRTNKKNIHVSALGKTDVTINRKKWEVGHNGKTWADSEEENPMCGPFDGVIYGVFADTDISNIVSLFLAKRVFDAIKYVCNRLYVFPDKEEHYAFMNSLSKGEGIQWKANIAHYQTRYNDGKHKAFKKGVKMYHVQSLREYMLSLGDNDYLD